MFSLKNHLVILIAFLAIFSSACAESIDSLKLKLKISTDNATKTEIFNKLGYQYLRISPVTSLDYANKALNLSSEDSNKYEMINSYLIIGMVKKTFGQYDIAAQNYFNALRIAEQLKLRDKESVCLNNIGSLYQTQNNLKKALEYFNKSLEIERTLKNKEQVSIRLYNIGVIYEAMDSLDMAYTYYFNSLLIEQELKNKEGEFYALYGISGIETKKGSFESAMISIRKALKIAEEINDKNGISLCYSELGALYKAINDYQKAIVAFDSCIYFASQITLRNIMRLAYKELSDIYSLQGNYQSAYRYLSLYTNINDTINNAEISSKVSELETRFEMEKQESTINYLKNAAELSEKVIKTEKRNKYFLLITFLLSIFLAVSNMRRILPETKNILLFSVLIFVFLLLLTFIIEFSGFYKRGFDIYLLFTSFVDVLTIATLPIFVFVLLAERFLMIKNLKTAQKISEQIQEYKMPENDSIIAFHFENEKNKFEIALKDLICIEANDNYSAFYYFKDNVQKKELFRTTLKRIEEQLNRNDEVIRCHKSFIVNIRHIRSITGNAQGYKLLLADLNFEIPVSRQFPKEILLKIQSNI